MKKAVRSAIVSMVVLLLLSTIVSVQAQSSLFGQANNSVITQNSATDSTANVLAQYFDPDGSLADSISTRIRPLAAKEFRTARDTSMASPWIGSMVLFSDKELASVANLLWEGARDGDGSTAASYPGPGQTSDVWYLPYVVLIPGGQAGQISVQNADSVPVTVDIRYYYRNESVFTAEVTDRIPEAGSGHYELDRPGRATVPDLIGLSGKSRWVGSVVVAARGGRQITAAYVNRATLHSAAYLGAAGLSLSKTLFGAMVVRNAEVLSGALTWQEWGEIILQNPNDRRATVNISFYSKNGGSLDKRFEDVSIGPHKVLRIDLKDGGGVPASELDALDWQAGAGVVWTGMVVVESDRPVCGIVLDNVKGRAISMYTMTGRYEASRTLYLPTVARIRSSGRWTLDSRIAVANPVSSSRAVVDLHFYDRSGNLDLSVPMRMRPKEIKFISMRGSAFSSLGDNWVGSVYVSSNRHIAGIVDTRWRYPTRQSSYNAIGE